MKNMTGRVFMCIDHEPDNEGLWNEFFVIGGMYFEAKLDIDGINLAADDEDMLIMMSNIQETLYVRRDCFALMLSTSEQLNRYMDGFK